MKFMITNQQFSIIINYSIPRLKALKPYVCLCMKRTFIVWGSACLPTEC
ncbi:MAG: hypothetical protein JWR05_2486 [Mucilaginibacter sp.]|nr:hypothetical protein [Mucilaginibacter sp.]